MSYEDLDRPPLDAAALRRALVRPGGLWTSVNVVATTGSTNDELIERALHGAVPGAVLVAESQTNGRGRLGRRWVTPPRSSLTMSVLLRPSGVPVGRWPWLPLIGGLATAAALRTDAGVEATLKWPNDVLVGGHKVGGILVARVEPPGDAPAAVIGIGVNVTQRADELPVSTATSLVLESARTTSRSILARSILRALEGVYGRWASSGGAADPELHHAYTESCSTVGRDVTVTLPDGIQHRGRATGVDGEGQLVVETGSGRRAFAAGDVVHLRGPS